MLALALRLLPMWQWIKRIAAAYPWQAALILALCWGAYERNHHVQWRAYAKRIEAAQKQAAADQVAVNHEPARVSGEIARKSNAEAPAYYRRLGDAAAAHAVRLSGPARPIGPAGVPGADQAEPSLHRADVDAGAPGADLVCRPAADDSWLVWAAGRAAQMQAEAAALIELGAAVPEPD